MQWHDDGMDSAVVPLLEALSNQVEGHLVRVISLKGFGLRDAGDGAVSIAGVIEGRILGGMADGAIAEHTANPGRISFRANVTDADADAAGMVCGGSARLLASPLSDLPAELLDLLAQAKPVAFVSAADGASGDLIVTNKTVAGSLGEGVLHLDAPVTQEAIEAARALLHDGHSQTATIDVEDVELVISTLVPATRAVVVGSGPMADAIAAQGALMGWTVTIDESVANGTAFCAGAGPADAIIILSHDREVDIPLLSAALDSPIGYIGAMGSRGTQSARRNRLGADGYSEGQLRRVHGPVGLDLGSRTPAETAVAIAAEFLANRAGGVAGSLSASEGPINR